MRKDYIPAEGHSADETAFVEKFWTDKWKNLDGPRDLSRITSQEEYRLMKPYVDRMPKGSRMLDAGCGLGEWTVLFGQQGYEAVGLDLSVDTVKFLQERFPAHQFVCGDIRKTSFEAESFDACFAWGTFEHFENGLGDCLNEVHRVMAPGGKLFISVPFHNWRLLLRDRRPLQSWDPDFSPVNGYQTPRRFYQWRFTVRELEAELEMRGFRVHSITPIHKASGVGRWMQWDFRLFKPKTRAFAWARSVFSRIMPAQYVSHMIMAIAERK